MAFFRHLRALLWKNSLLWRRKLFGSLCEVFFPIIMVGLVVAVRQAIKNKDFETGNHLEDGFLYPHLFSTPGQFDNDILTYLKINETTHVSPIAFGALNYTLVGDPNSDRYKDLFTYLQPVIEIYKQFVGVDLLFTEGIETEEELFEKIRGNDYQRNHRNESFLFAIEVPPTGFYNFTIFQSANFPDFIPDTQFFDTTAKPDFDNFRMYSQNGFVTLQNLLANFVLNEENPGSHVETFIATGKTQAFTRDNFMDNIGPTLALFILLIFIAPQYRLISFITIEKASRAREGMKMMGLNDAPYWLSWFIYYISICITISIV